MSAPHTPASLKCIECEGQCLRLATIDEANTALTVARTLEEKLFAAEALEEAAEILVFELRNKQVSRKTIWSRS